MTSSKRPNSTATHRPRGQTTRVKTAKGRRLTSTRWLQRQLNDPYVQRAQKDGYRSRAAYKLLEINKQHQLFSSKSCIVDLGAAPGGWTQIAVACTKHPTDEPGVLGIDLQPIDDIEGAVCYQGDVFDPETLKLIHTHFPQKIDVLLSDMAPATCGHPATDHLRSVELVEEVVAIAPECLKRGGHLLVKLFRGGEEHAVKMKLQRFFQHVYTIKPEASRKGSTEIYLLAKSFSA